MPWYYAGPEAKPVGPVTLEELHALRVSGVLSPETYVIEHTGQAADAMTWKRYREAFPANPAPPLPPPFSPVPLPPPPPQATKPAPHPLFPSAAPVHDLRPVSHQLAATSSTRISNAWCQWGFWLGLASLPLLLACGFGALVALPALFLCVIGLVQVLHHPEQAGRGLAITGLLCAALALIITLLCLAVAVPAYLKAHGQTVTEQSTNDSQ